MQFFKNLFGTDLFFTDNSIVGLSGLHRKTEYQFIEIPKEIKKTFVTNVENNYLLI